MPFNKSLMPWPFNSCGNYPWWRRNFLCDIKDMAALRVEATNVSSLMLTLTAVLVPCLSKLKQNGCSDFRRCCFRWWFWFGSDVSISRDNAQFGLPETGLFLRKLLLSWWNVLAWLPTCFTRYAFWRAYSIKCRHQIAHNEIELEQALEETTLNEQLLKLRVWLKRCYIQWTFKWIARWCCTAVCSSGAEGQEGTMAFIQKRLPMMSHKR